MDKVTFGSLFVKVASNDPRARVLAAITGLRKQAAEQRKADVKAAVYGIIADTMQKQAAVPGGKKTLTNARAKVQSLRSQEAAKAIGKAGRAVMKGGSKGVNNNAAKEPEIRTSTNPNGSTHVSLSYPNISIKGPK